MAAPGGYYLSSQECSGSTTTASATATFPATPKVGSLLVCSAFTNTGAGTQTMTGWTKLSEAVLVSSGQSVAVWAKRSDGTETATTVAATGATVCQLVASEIRSWGLGVQTDPASWTLGSAGANMNDYTTTKKDNSGSSTSHSFFGAGFNVRGFPYIGILAVALSGSTTSWSFSQTDGGSSQMMASPPVRCNMAIVQADSCNFALQIPVESGGTLTLGTARSAGLAYAAIPLGTRHQLAGAGGVLQ